MLSTTKQSTVLQFGISDVTFPKARVEDPNAHTEVFAIREVQSSEVRLFYHIVEHIFALLSSRASVYFSNCMNL